MLLPFTLITLVSSVTPSRHAPYTRSRSWVWRCIFWRLSCCVLECFQFLLTNKDNDLYFVFIYLFICINILCIHFYYSFIYMYIYLLLIFLFMHSSYFIICLCIHFSFFLAEDFLISNYNVYICKWTSLLHHIPKYSRPCISMCIKKNTSCKFTARPSVFKEENHYQISIFSCLDLTASMCHVSVKNFIVVCHL